MLYTPFLYAWSFHPIAKFFVIVAISNPESVFAVIVLLYCTTSATYTAHQM